jgi:hypothetical protein
MGPFGHNNQQQYQNYANAWDQGTYGQIPEQEARQHYQQFVQNAPPQAVEQAHAQYYAQMPPQERTSVVQALLNSLTQHGYNPREAGIQNTDPNTMSPQDAARLTAYARQKNPDILQQVFGPGGPLHSTAAKLAVAGVLALAAKHFLSASGSQGGGRF